MILAEKTESLAALITACVSDLRARVETLESRLDAVDLLLERMGILESSDLARDGKEL